MIDKQRLGAVAAGCLLALSLAGCGGSSSASSGAESAAQDEPKETRVVDEPEEAPEGAAAEEDSKSESKVAVTIDNATLSEDYNGDPVVIVTYTFTNVSSDEAESFMLSCVPEVYQNGVECEYAFVTGLEGDSSAKVKKGGSTTLQQAYKIQDRSDVEVEVKEAFSWEDVTLATATFSFE